MFSLVAHVLAELYNWIKKSRETRPFKGATSRFAHLENLAA